MSDSVSLPSIQEMFPDHLMGTKALQQTPRSESSPRTPPSVRHHAPNHGMPNDRTMGVPARKSSSSPPYTMPRNFYPPSTSSQPNIPSASPHVPDYYATHGTGYSGQSNSSTHFTSYPVSTGVPYPGPTFDGNDPSRKHVCHKCNKRFNRPSSLRIHLNTHTGATPFRCPWPGCGREFNVNSNMRRHYRNHTASANESAPATIADGSSELPDPASNNQRRKKSTSAPLVNNAHSGGGYQPYPRPVSFSDQGRSATPHSPSSTASPSSSFHLNSPSVSQGSFSEGSTSSEGGDRDDQDAEFGRARFGLPRQYHGTQEKTVPNPLPLSSYPDVYGSEGRRTHGLPSSFSRHSSLENASVLIHHAPYSAGLSDGVSPLSESFSNSPLSTASHY